MFNFGVESQFEKSTLLGINIDDELLQNMAALSSCELGVWLIKYLGLPLGGNAQKIDFWELVVTKVAKKLDGWKKASLSRGGRLTLIHSVLSSIPIYYGQALRELLVWIGTKFLGRVIGLLKAYQLLYLFFCYFSSVKLGFLW